MRQKRRKYRRFKRPDSRGNATAPKVLVKHASGSRALQRARFDMRSVVGKAYRQSLEELVHHLGGPNEISAVERRLVDNVSRLRVLMLLAQDEMNRSGDFHDGAPAPAQEAYRRALESESQMLKSLGLRPRAKRASLGQVLTEGDDDAD